MRITRCQAKELKALLFSSQKIGFTSTARLKQRPAREKHSVSLKSGTRSASKNPSFGEKQWALYDAPEKNRKRI